MACLCDKGRRPRPSSWNEVVDFHTSFATNQPIGEKDRDSPWILGFQRNARLSSSIPFPPLRQQR